jgi:hypothetical protein
MIDTRWAARVRPDRRGYPLLDRQTWYPVSSSSEVGYVVKLWGKEVFIFAEDVELRLAPDEITAPTDLHPIKALRSSLASTRRTRGYLSR